MERLIHSCKQITQTLCCVHSCNLLACQNAGRRVFTWAEGAIWCKARASTLAVTPVPHEAMMGFLRSTPASLKTVLSASGPLYFPSRSTWYEPGQSARQ